MTPFTVPIKFNESPSPDDASAGLLRELFSQRALQAKISQVLCLLDELDTGKFDVVHWQHGHPQTPAFPVLGDFVAKAVELCVEVRVRVAKSGDSGTQFNPAKDEHLSSQFKTWWELNEVALNTFLNQLASRQPTCEYFLVEAAWGGNYLG